MENLMPSFALCHSFSPAEAFPKHFYFSVETLKQNKNYALGFLVFHVHVLAFGA